MFTLVLGQTAVS